MGVRESEVVNSVRDTVPQHGLQLGHCREKVSSTSISSDYSRCLLLYDCMIVSL